MAVNNIILFSCCGAIKKKSCYLPLVLYWGLEGIPSLTKEKETKLCIVMYCKISLYFIDKPIFIHKLLFIFIFYYSYLSMYKHNRIIYTFVNYS